MAIEVSSGKVICAKCGTAYGNRKNNFPVSYAESYKGTGYIPLCRKCVEAMYSKYLSQCGDSKSAVRQVCRKLDLYWKDSIYESVAKKSSPHSIISQYIAKLNNVSSAGKSYDDTLLEEGTMWKAETQMLSQNGDGEGISVPITDEVIAFWGSGYSPETYERLEQRRKYYMSKFPQAFGQQSGSDDIGSDVLMRQLCNLEVSIANDAAAGKSIDKSVNSLNTLIGSLNLKPAQKKDDGDSAYDKTPFGVWIQRWENERPIPEPDPEFQDVDGIVRYVSIWFFGHLCKMLGIKNSYCKLYEDELAKMRVEMPEYEDEDDETMFNDIFSSDDSD